MGSPEWRTAGFPGISSQPYSTNIIPLVSGQDMYQFMDDEMKEYFSDVIIPGYNEIEGKLYFLPTTGTTCRLFYNKEIFERVGIEEPPATLEEMVEDAKLITSQLKGE